MNWSFASPSIHNRLGVGVPFKSGGGGRGQPALSQTSTRGARVSRVRCVHPWCGAAFSSEPLVETRSQIIDISVANFHHEPVRI